MSRPGPCRAMLVALAMHSAPVTAGPPTPSVPPSPPTAAPKAPAPPHGIPAERLTPPDATKLRFLDESAAGLPVVGLQVGDTRYAVELVTTDATRAKGMGGRRAFPAGTAMLFVNPDDRVRRYWMVDCLVDIDVAFIDRFGRITAMHRMKAEPPRGRGERADRYTSRLKRYSSRRPARYALELPSGELTRLGLKVGQALPMPHAPLQALAR